jgi:quercetin dioxygenase-like cupin family protein
MSVTARTRLFVATAAVLFSGATAMLTWPGAVVATPPSGFASDVRRSFFENIRVPGGTGLQGENAKVKIFVRESSDVYVVNNTVAAGGNSGWHTHPGPSVVSVKTGTATVYMGDDPSCTPTNYPAGTGFIDAGRGHVHLVRNEGTLTLETVALQFVPAGAARRIDAPNPGFCPF